MPLVVIVTGPERGVLKMADSMRGAPREFLTLPARSWIRGKGTNGVGLRSVLGSGGGGGVQLEIAIVGEIRLRVF